MMSGSLVTFAVPLIKGLPFWLEAVAGLFALFVLFVIVAFKLYKRTESDIAFVRTGVGGMRVVVDGGCLVVPVLHEIKPISLSTMQLAVDRRGKDALITRDRYRCDVSGEFYIRVDPKEDRIMKASRSLGDRSLSPKSVQQLVEAKLIGALRSVAATLDLIELHQNREEFADKVKENLHEDLLENGLTLESVGVTNLDQTDKEALDPNNVFDAEGLKKITDATEKARAEKNLIQRTREAEIAVQDREAREKVLNELEKTENAEAKQKRNVDVFQKERQSETEKFAIEQDELVEERRIQKDKRVKEANLEAELELIQKRQDVEEREIQKNLSIERAEIAKETDLIERRQAMEEAEMRKQLAVAQAEKDKEIGIIRKVQEQEDAEAEKLAAVAERERAEQHVLTVEATEKARRDKEVEIINQQARSEKDQIQQQIAADAWAYEAQKRAEGDLEAAELKAKAIERMAAAKLKDAQAEAEGERKKFEAKNLVKRDVLFQEAAIELIQKSPEIIREAMAPAEKIDGIKVLHVSGMHPNGGSNGEQPNLAGGIVNSFLQAGAALPMLKEFLKFADIDADDKGSIRDMAKQAIRRVAGVEEDDADGADAGDEEPDLLRPSSGEEA